MKLIILDRDGVINYDQDHYIKSPEEWIPIPGSLEAIARLTHAGYHIVVATNQSGVGRGHLNIETLHCIHQKMHHLTFAAGGLIEAIVFCTAVEENHYYRKPNPGMLEDISRRLKVSLEGVPAIGDSLRDLLAAQKVGAKPILVRTGKGEQTLKKTANDRTILVFEDLASAADFLITHPD
jgi:D-glycero-D-manno-heptose 1,7-bisphosphate phosphatase